MTLSMKMKICYVFFLLAGLCLAVDVYTPSHKHKRQPQSQSNSIASQPNRRLASCPTTAEACSNATNDCSGHGQCISAMHAGRECFVCACANTKSSSGKTESWAGEMCQRKDISSTFVLIAGTAISLVLLMGGSVSLLYSIGDHELPSILTGGVASGLKRE